MEGQLLRLYAGNRIAGWWNDIWANDAALALFMIKLWVYIKRIFIILINYVFLADKTKMFDMEEVFYSQLLTTT